MALQRRSRTSVAQLAGERGNLAAVVGARRRELNLTQVELAGLAGVSTRFVHAVESGRTEVGFDRLLTLLDTLGLHVQLERGASSRVDVSTPLAQHYGLQTAPDDRSR